MFDLLFQERLTLSPFCSAVRVCCSVNIWGIAQVLSIIPVLVFRANHEIFLSPQVLHCLILVFNLCWTANFMNPFETMAVEHTIFIFFLEQLCYKLQDLRSGHVAGSTCVYPSNVYHMCSLMKLNHDLSWITIIGSHPFMTTYDIIGSWSLS